MTTDGSPVALGLDIGGSSVKGALLMPDGSGRPRVRATALRPLSAHRPIDEAMDAVVSLADELRGARTESLPVGLAVPGIFDAATGMATVLPNFPADWLGFPIRDELERRTGHRIHLVNDAKAFAFAEARVGAGAGYRSVACVVLGTGVGGGLVVDGELWSGQGTAGEFGHITVDLEGPPCGCGNHGCVEAYAGADAIARAAGRSTAEDVFAAAELGDPDAIAAVDRAVRALAGGLANVFIATAPDVFVVGGGVAGSAGQIMEPLLRETRRRVRVAPPDQIRLVRGSLGRHAGAIGAALWAAASSRSVSFESEGVS